MEEFEEGMDEEKFFEKLQASDLKSMDKAMNRLIDPVSKFKMIETMDELTPDDFVELLYALEHAHFVVAGVMYSYGMNVYEDCDHEHDEEEDED